MDSQTTRSADNNQLHSAGTQWLILQGKWRSKREILQQSSLHTTAILVTSAGFVSKALGLDLYCSRYRLLMYCGCSRSSPVRKLTVGRWRFCAATARLPAITTCEESKVRKTTNTKMRVRKTVLLSAGLSDRKMKICFQDMCNSYSDNSLLMKCLLITWARHEKY